MTVSVAVALVLGVFGALAIGAAQSGASVVAVGGQAVLVNPPAVVARGVDSSHSEMRMFTERSTYTLPQSLPVDITPNGTFPMRWNTGLPLSPSDVAAGTPVDSYFMISNPAGTYGQQFTFDATVSFYHSHPGRHHDWENADCHRFDSGRARNGLPVQRHESRIRRRELEQSRPGRTGECELRST